MPRKNDMKSPFPGMNPFLEQRWRDVHTRLMTYISEALMELLPGNLIAQIEEQVSIETFIPHAVRYIPDVSVVETGSEVRLGAAGTSAAVAEPDLKPNPVILPVEPTTKRHIEIVDFNSGDKVVTVIEVLSPANKVGEGRDRYVAKRDRFNELPRSKLRGIGSVDC
jgi:hypothetical protein